MYLQTRPQQLFDVKQRFWRKGRKHSFMCQSHSAGLRRESVHGQASKNCRVSDGLLSLVVLVNPSTLSFLILL